AGDRAPRRRAAGGAGRTVGAACQALRADRRAGHSAHGHGGPRHRGVGRARARRRPAARAPPGRRTPAGAGRAQPLPRADASGRALGLRPARALADEAENPAPMAFRAIKRRLGYPPPAEDLAALAAVKGRVPAGTDVMVDYNQALTVAEALRRGRALEQEHVA